MSEKTTRKTSKEYQIINVDEKYDKIGSNYNVSRKADPYISDRLLRHLATTKTGKYLDIGCGTGNYTFDLSRRGVSFVGIDPSTEMLKKARERVSSVEWKVGKSENIPLEDESIDGAMATLTIHHWGDLRRSFGEINRVLRPHSRFVIFTSTSEQMKGYWLNYYFPKMLKDSRKQMPKYREIENSLIESGFEIIETEKYVVRKDLVDMFLYSGKHNPSLYLDAIVRQGISSFSELANRGEVVAGLEKLKKDIDSGKIKEITERYKNDEGDYLFVVGRRS